MSKLTSNELKQLDAIDNKVDYNFSISVKEHFNKIGKLQDFAATATDAEKKEQKQLIKELMKTGSSENSVKILNLFIKAARRVGNDQDLAAYLPQKSFTDSDAALLDKVGCKDYAALVRLAV